MLYRASLVVVFAAVPKPTAEHNRCILRHVTPKTLQ
jgi:hypothetical protein